MSPIEGTITYSYNWDTTPQNCISGDCIISQNISIDDQFETDVFAQQVVLGRAAGPILQDIGTVTARVRTINIELVTIPPTGCGDLDTIYDPVPTGQITNLTGLVYDDLTANYSQVFISQNTQNWNFTQGRYTKSVGFTYNTCST